jgi:hypothetical protein
MSGLPLRSTPFMPSESDATRSRLNDIRHHIEMANGFIAGLNYDAFKDDTLR